MIPHFCLASRLRVAALVASLLVVNFTVAYQQDSTQRRSQVLKNISDLTKGNLGTLCSSGSRYQVVNITIPLSRYEVERGKINVATKILENLKGYERNDILPKVAQDLFTFSKNFVSVSVSPNLESDVTVIQAIPSGAPGFAPKIQNENDFKDAPWFQSATDPANYLKSESWTFPYYSCAHKSWIISHWTRIYRQDYVSTQKGTPLGVLAFEVDVSYLDVNQCPIHFHNKTEDENDVIDFFDGTHKCHLDSSECLFVPGAGWTLGSYQCQCKEGYFSWIGNGTFDGALVEMAWHQRGESWHPDGSGLSLYDRLYICQKCANGCESCDSDAPCLSTYNWSFRIALLAISILCALFTGTLMGLVYFYREVKVFKLASPIFLCICLVGCIIMYLEMICIYPVLNVPWCIATKWSRHMGFCITFSSLLMKTWRVSLTYRVKSAHKIKLTDNQLLQWQLPILLIMGIYLSSWTISDPPVADDIKDWSGLSFKQCEYGWWDHCLAAGEMLFLVWGVKVCFGVRKAESFFDEAKCISFAVYNITFVNILMALFHLFIFPRVGPDWKYLLGFIRTQLSTTTTIGLIFGPKFYRVLKGTGDQYDSKTKAKGAAARFPLNGMSCVSEEPADLYQENEELKEEIQKMAAQMEFMKIVHMEMNNRHLKPRSGGYFSEKNQVMNPSPSVNRGSYKLEDNSSTRISPAAEHTSDGV